MHGYAEADIGEGQIVSEVTDLREWGAIFSGKPVEFNLKVNPAPEISKETFKLRMISTFLNGWQKIKNNDISPAW